MGIGTRKQVQLIFKPTAQAATGQWEAQSNQVYDAWAEITAPRGLRVYLNGQTQLQETKDFEVRFRFDLFPGADWFVRYDGKDWAVSVIEKVKEKKFYWSIRATEK